MVTKDKVTELFCIIDEFDKNFDLELKKHLLPVTDGEKPRNRKASLSDSEIMTIFLLFHFGSYRNFKDSCIFCIREHMKHDFTHMVSYNRFVELEQYVFFELVFFLKLFAFRRCKGISFVSSTDDIGMSQSKVLCQQEIQRGGYRWQRHISVNLMTVSGTYCCFEDKPEALQGYYIDDSKQQALF